MLVGLEQMIVFAQNDTDSLNEYFENLKEEIVYHKIDGKISVYANVDRSLFDGGVALTNKALRESASTGDSSWYSEDNINLGLSITLGSLAGVSLATSIAVLATSEKLNGALQRSIGRYYTNVELASIAAVEKREVAIVCQELAAKYGAIETFLPEYQIVASVDDLTYFLPYEIVSENTELLVDAESSSRRARLKAIDEANDARVSAMNRSMGTINTVAYVALGLSLLVEAVRIGIKLYNYYHPEYSAIPRIIVDEIATEADNYYIRYYAALDQDGEYADLNAWKGQRWNALYTTKDKDAGDPILASGLTAQVKDSSMPTAQSYAVHYFGETGACNVSRYLLKKTSPATYIFFTRDHSLRATASTFSRGTVITFASIGLLGGIAIGSLGAIGAGKLRKKKEESASADAK